MLVMCARNGCALPSVYGPCARPILRLNPLPSVTGNCSVHKKIFMINKSARTTSELTSCTMVGGWVGVG